MNRYSCAHRLRWLPAAVGASLGALGTIGCSASQSADGAGSSMYDPNAGPATGTNVNLGGSQDFGFFRGQVEAGVVPLPDSLDAAGFFAEHHTELPPATCGERICLQPMLAVMGNLLDGSNCTMLELALNSPLAADPGLRPPLSLAVVIDTSGSMQGTKIDYVRQGLHLLVDGMKDGDELALVRYSDAASVPFPMAAVENHRVELRGVIDSLVADGATNLASGLVTGYREALAHYDSGRQNRVILLSDGNPTAGITTTEAILDLSRTFNSDGIGLTTIGLGSDFNIELMRDLALQADGNFYFVEDAAAVDEVFTEELDYFVVPIAFDLQVRLTTSDLYTFGRALGTPFWSDTLEGGTLDVPSAFLAHRESDADVTSDGGRRGGGSMLLVELMPSLPGEPGSPVATVDLTFREPGTNRLVSDSVEVTYPYAPGDLLPEGYFQADNVASLQKSFVMLNIFVGMEQAVLGFHRGAAGVETIRGLDSLIAAVVDYNEEVADVDIAADIDMLVELRDNLVLSGVPEQESPPPANPWPAD